MLIKFERLNPNIVTHILSISIGFIIITSLFSILEPLVIIIWAILTFLGISLTYKNRGELLNPTIRFILALTLVFFIILTNIEKNWQMVLAYVLVLLLGIKSLELKSLRDVFQVTGLSVLGIGVASFLRFDLTLGIFLLIVLVLSILMMLWQHIVDSVSDQNLLNQKKWFNLFLKSSLVSSFIIFILIIPLSLFFFFLLPRSFTPLFKGQSGFNVAKTGFSSKMSPGQFSEIVASDEVAFRAKIEPNPTNPQNLYWIGAILWTTDGTEWVPNPPEQPDFTPAMTLNALKDNYITQTITLPAKDEPFLFSLWKPLKVDGLKAVQYFRDGTIKSTFPINIPIRYTVYSSDRTTDTGLTFNERQAALSLPKNLDDRIRTLAMELKGDLKDNTEIAKTVELYLKKPPFKYSLKSPQGFENGQTLSDFLFTTKTGYCELYASAMATLLRTINIPSRVAIGYKGGEYNPMGDYWVIREKTAHAWVQVYIPQKGWINFDPTPTGGIFEPTIAEANRARNETVLISQNKRVWDWLQWQWSNIIIDLTPEKQRLIWRETGIKIGQLFYKDIPKLSLSIDKIRINLKQVILVLFIISIIGLLTYLIMNKTLKISKFKFFNSDLRKRAIIKLARKTPVKGKFYGPGEEKIYLKWWRENKPQKYDKICEIYYFQRYGKNPTWEIDKELDDILRLD